MILLDTHVMLWLRLGERELGTRARAEIDRAWQSGEVAVSAISFWEVAMLKAKGRIKFPEDVELWRREQLAQGVVEIAVDGEIGIHAVGLADFHADPADRLSRVLSVKFFVSTTSVSPSQRPRESPTHWRTFGGRCVRPSRGMMRALWTISLSSTTYPGT